MPSSAFSVSLSAERWLHGVKDLLVERARFGQHEDAKPWNKILAPLVGLGGGLIPLVAGLEALLGSSPSFGLPVKLLSLVISLACYALGYHALMENRFFSGMVRIQTERGHRLVSSGQYGRVWHPGYAGPLWTYGQGSGIPACRSRQERTEKMANEVRDVLRQQFETAWGLTVYHLRSLSTEECLWRPAEIGLQVHQERDGRWLADWPEHEGYDLGPSSIGWLTWHLGFWWAMVLDDSCGEGTLSREQVFWPGSADGVRLLIGSLEEEWRGVLDSVTDDELRSTDRTRWPFRDRPFCDVVAWENVELVKNAAEIGYARFLYAVRAG